MADKSLWMDYPSDKSGDSSLLLGDVEAPFGMTDDFPPTPGPRARIKGKDNSSTILEGSPQRLKSAIDVWEEKQKGGQGEKGVEAILTESGKGVTSSNRSSAHSRFAGMGLAKEGSRPSPVSKGMKTSAFLAGVPSGKRVQVSLTFKLRRFVSYIRLCIRSILIYLQTCEQSSPPLDSPSYLLLRNHPKSLLARSPLFHPPNPLFVTPLFKNFSRKLLWLVLK